VILLVRHGRTESNASGLLLGRADPPLDELGRSQAEQLAEVLTTERGVFVDRIISSPLARTRETAAAIGAATGIAVEVDDRFVELDYGEWDQRPLRDVAAADWAEWRRDVTFTPPGGESLADLGVRVRAGLEALAEHAARHDVVVVTHVSPIKAAVAWALRGTDDMAWRMFVAPATITRIATAGGHPSLHGFNDGGHLT
jgi:broad specificity phosphatase PhoE